MYTQFVDYLAQVFCLERLRHLKDPAIGWDGPKFFVERVLLFDCVTEVYCADFIHIPLLSLGSPKLDSEVMIPDAGSL